MIKINRNANLGIYKIDDIFAGLKETDVVSKIFNTREELNDVFSNTEIIIDQNCNYMRVKNDDAVILIGLNHLKTSDEMVLYLDIIHELVHVKQQLHGMDLYDESYSYVDRPTEIEAYSVTVEEAKRMGMTNLEIMNYLHVDWITPEEHRRLALKLGVKT